MEDNSDPPKTTGALLWGLLPCRAEGEVIAQAQDLLTRIAELRQARDTGALIVRHGDEQTTFRSLAEMNAIIAELEAQAGVVPPALAGVYPTKRIHYRYTKGMRD